MHNQHTKIIASYDVENHQPAGENNVRDMAGSLIGAQETIRRTWWTANRRTENARGTPKLDLTIRAERTRSLTDFVFWAEANGQILPFVLQPSQRRIVMTDQCISRHELESIGLSMKARPRQKSENVQFGT